MTLNVECGFCGGAFEVDDIHAGRRVRCPACKRIVRVPPQGEFAARTDQPARKADPPEPAASNGYEVEEGRPTKAEPPPPVPAEKPEERVPDSSEGVGMRRVGNVLMIAVAISAALAIWNSFSSVWAAIEQGKVASQGMHEVTTGFRAWAHGVVPSLKQLRPESGRPLSPLDRIIVAAILSVLALRVVLRGASLGAASDLAADKNSQQGIAGLVFQFLTLMLLVAIVSAAGSAAGDGRIMLSSGLIASFMVLSALSLAVMLLAARQGGLGLMAGAFNDGVFGAATVVLVSRGGIPHAPFGVLQQCAVLALADSIVGLAISGSNFEGGSRNVARGLGFSALGVIILVVAVVLFSAAG